MEQQYLISRKKAEAVSTGVFLISLGILFYFNYWWPGILLAIWAYLATRQSLTGRHFDLAISSIILLGLFFVMTFDISWSTLGPLLFVIGGAYMIFREYYFASEGSKRPSKQKTQEEDELEVYEEEE